MSRNTKIILGVVGALLVICLGICGIGAFLLPRFAERAFSRDPQQVRQVSASIAQYTLPPGYYELMGMDLFTTKMVGIGPQNGQGMIFILIGTNTPGVDRQQLEQQMRQAFQQQFRGGTTNMQYVGDETVTIRGESVPLTITENDTSPKMRQAIGGFAGDHGYVMVMATGDTTVWNDTLLHDFLSSIK